MADSRGEPTMEEILASIRRIIADDPAPAGRLTPRKTGGRSSEAPDPEPASGEAPSPDGDAAAGTASFEAHFEAARQEIDIPPVPEETAEPGAPEEEVLELTDVAGGEAPAEDPAIVSDATASATAERLKALSSAMAGPESGSVTLEGLVREMLRPMLTDWLDRNLPDIVDEVVSREIARLTGKGR